MTAPNADAADSRTLLAFEGVSFAYGGSDAVRDVTLAIEAGEFVAIAGPNGGGKSTLLRLALGLLAPESGRVELFSRPPREFADRDKVGFVPQRPFTPVDFPATVREVVASGRWPRLRYFGRTRRQDREMTERAIEQVGLGAMARRRLGELSGGQQQRVHLARALATEPSLLMLDEPMAGVDIEAQEKFRELLGGLMTDSKLTVLLVAHEYGPLAELVERLVILAQTIRYDGPPPTHEREVHQHHGLAAEYLSLWAESEAEGGDRNSDGVES